MSVRIGRQSAVNDIGQYTSWRERGGVTEEEKQR